MKEQTNWLFVIVFFFSVLGFLTSGILAFVNRNQSVAPRILALIVFCISYSLMGYGLYVSEEFLNYPHLWRTPIFFSLCVAPLTYIYVRSVLEQAYRLRRTDVLFLLPAFLYTAQLIPFYLLSAQEKIPFIQQAIHSRAFGIRETEGLLPPGIAFFFRMSFNLGLLGYTVYMLIRWRRTSRAALLLVRENQQIFNWLFYLTFALILCFVSLIFESLLFLVTDKLDKARLPTLTVTVTIGFICSYLYVKPELLYGFRGWIPLAATEVANGQQDEKAGDITPVNRKVNISLEQGRFYKQLIEEHFNSKKPFVKQRYSIKDLSVELGTPAYLLSAFINQEFGKNFNEFVNDNRVDYLINLVKQEPEKLNYTLEVLGKMGGFNSRSAFIESVKRKTGEMPSVVFQKRAGI